jgi:hypothetical protein
LVSVTVVEIQLYVLTINTPRSFSIYILSLLYFNFRKGRDYPIRKLNINLLKSISDWDKRRVGKGEFHP